MAGKITFRNGPHPSSIGAIVEPFQLTERDWRRFEDIIGRGLVPEERARISETVEYLRHITRVLDSNNVSAQDVKETLRAIARAKGGNRVQQGVANCDAQSRFWLDRALYAMGERVDYHHKPAAAFRAAALLALQDFKKCNGRPPRGRPYFCRFALSMWVSLGRTDDAVWQIEGEATPLTRFATALLALVEDSPPGYSQVAKAITNFRKVSA